MKSSALAVAIASLALISSGPARAGLIYDNGPVSNAGGYNINSFSVTNSFTVSTTTTLTSATIGVMVNLGDVPLTTSWSIGTSAFGSEIASGVSPFSNTNLGNLSNGFDVYASSFSIEGVVTAGTYWLTLTGVATTDGLGAYWNTSSGPSSAFQTFSGSIPSESFQIYDATAVPEPATWALMSLGLVCVPMLRRGNRAA